VNVYISELMEDVKKPQPSSSSSLAAGAAGRGNNAAVNSANVNTSTNAATLLPQVSRCSS